jgi:DNA primase
MKWLDYAAIRHAITMRQILELIAYQPTRIVGNQWRGPCPICRSSSPTKRFPFSVDVRKQLFRCFHCHRSGNVLDLWMAITKLPLPRATCDLCSQLHIQPINLQNTQPKNRP